MNTYTKKIVDVVRAYKKAVDEHAAEKVKLAEKQNKGTIAAADFLTKTTENNGRLNQAIADRLQRLQEIVEEYEQAYEKWAVVKGSDVTEDMALLTSGMQLDPSDYEKMEQSYTGNYTMLKAIRSHAERNKVSYSASATIDKERKQRALLELIGVAKKTFAEGQGGFSINNIAFEDDEQFMKWYGTLDRLIALG